MSTETCHDCPRLLRELAIVVSVYKVHLCTECYIKRLERKYSCPRCKRPFQAREATEILGGVLVHVRCP